MDLFKLQGPINHDTPALDHQEGSGAGLDQDYSSLETLKENKLEDRYVEWTHKF